MKTDPSKKCTGLGGAFDAESGNCTIDLTKDDHGSVSSKGMLPFFVLQIAVAIGTSILSTYYGYSVYPPNNEATYVITAIMVFLSTIMIWYKVGEWKETMLRTAIAVLTIGGMSWIIGSFFYWDAAAFLDVTMFTNGPVMSVMYGLPIFAFLSFLLVDPQQRQSATSGSFMALEQ